MSPIYKFSLNEETGKIVVQEIVEYATGNWSNNTIYWRYRGSGCSMYIYENKLDRYLSGHVYSFNPDITHARKIILESVNAKVSKAFKDYKRWVEVQLKLEANK